MAFDHLKAQGERSKLCLKKRETRAPVAEIHVGEVMVAPAKTLVDDLVGRPPGLDHVPEGRESLCREWWDGEAGGCH